MSNNNPNHQSVVRFTNEEIDTIKKLIHDWGFEYSLGLNADVNKVEALAAKLSVGIYKRENKNDK